MEFHFAIPKSISGLYNNQKQINNTTFTKSYTSFEKISKSPNRSGNNFYNYNNNSENKSKSIINLKSESEVFSIANKVVTDDEWESIKTYLNNSPVIKEIKLSGISIDSKGLLVLGEILVKNKNIKSLTLDWNYLNEYIEEFESFCEILTSSFLQILNLNNNRLSSAHINGLLKLLKCNHLLVLNLKWNEIGNDTARSLISHIKSNISIQEINLSQNKISHELLSELEENMLKNKKEKYYSNYKKAVA